MGPGTTVMIDAGDNRDGSADGSFPDLGGDSGTDIGSSDAMMVDSGDLDAGAFRVAFYASTDTTVNAQDVLLGVRPVTSLAAGAATGSAIIVSAEDTHSRRDASHYVRFKLRLQKDGAERVIESMTLVNPYDFQRYPPGASVRCRVLDDNPEYFAFVE